MLNKIFQFPAGIYTVLLGPSSMSISPPKVAYVAKELHDMVCFKISLGDTIGIATQANILKFLLINFPNVL